MVTRKNKVFPILITVLIIIIIIYLFTTIKQPFIECSKTSSSNINISVNENLKTNLDGNKISKLELTKTIEFNDELINNNPKIINDMKYAIEKAYNYLGSKAKITTTDNKIVINAVVSKNETLILNNIEFVDDSNGPQIKIDTNTKSSNVVTLKVSDKYTEGEFMTRMKNNGYICK